MILTVLYLTLCFIVHVTADCYFVDKPGHGITADTRLHYQILDTKQMCHDLCTFTEGCTVTIYERYGCHLLQRPLLSRQIVSGLEECKDECYYNEDCGLLQLVREDSGINVCWLYIHSDIKQTIYHDDVVSIKYCEDNTGNGDYSEGDKDEERMGDLMMGNWEVMSNDEDMEDESENKEYSENDSVNSEYSFYEEGDGDGDGGGGEDGDEDGYDEGYVDNSEYSDNNYDGSVTEYNSDYSNENDLQYW